MGILLNTVNINQERTGIKSTANWKQYSSVGGCDKAVQHLKYSGTCKSTTGSNCLLVLVLYFSWPLQDGSRVFLKGFSFAIRSNKEKILQSLQKTDCIQQKCICHMMGSFLLSFFKKCLFNDKTILLFCTSVNSEHNHFSARRWYYTPTFSPQWSCLHK